jgi:hypothetical protein
LSKGLLIFAAAGTGTEQFAHSQDVTSALTNPVAQWRVALEFSSNSQFGGFIVDNGGFVQ